MLLSYRISLFLAQGISHYLHKISLIYTKCNTSYVRSRDKFNKEPSGDLSPCFESGRLESEFSSPPKRVMIYSMISCFQFLQITLKGCVFILVQNGNIGLKYQKVSKTTPAFHNYILIFFPPAVKGAEEALTMVVVMTTTTKNEVNHLWRCES